MTAAQGFRDQCYLHTIINIVSILPPCCLRTSYSTVFHVVVNHNNNINQTRVTHSKWLDDHTLTRSCSYAIIYLVWFKVVAAPSNRTIGKSYIETTRLAATTFLASSIRNTFSEQELRIGYLCVSLAPEQQIHFHSLHVLSTIAYIWAGLFFALTRN